MTSVLMLLAGLGCAPPGPGETGAPPDTGEGAAPLRLRWVPTAGEPWEEALAGLWWGLAGLGAAPAAAAVSEVREDSQGISFTLHVDALGLEPVALAALEEGLAPVRAAQARLGMPHVELGRLLQRTLHEPWVYYAVTGACTDLAAWSVRLPEPAPTVAITASLLTAGDRRLAFAPSPGSALDIAWAAEEGTGSLEAGDFVARETEVLDLMPNGRFRYAVYDADGALVSGSDPALSPAGQPGRCMWCHENHLMTTVVQPDLPGHASHARFVDEIGAQQAQVEALRATRGGPVDWQTHAVHAWGEVLVEGFLRAPTERLAAEWWVEPETVEAWMAASGVTPVRSEEHPSWGPLWPRAAADAAFAAHRAELPDDHPLAGGGGRPPLAVLPSARDRPAPGTPHWIPPSPHACAPTGAPPGGAE